jgi:glutathione S-transferase
MAERGRQATLYVIPGSHACASAKLMLAHKDIAYRTITLPTGAHPLLVRMFGFPGHRDPIRSLDGETPAPLATLDRLGTVPALRIDGERVQTNRAIARHLERVRPLPPLFPADPARRQAVEAAERWGDEQLQMIARRLALAAPAARGLDTLSERGGDGRLGALLSRNALIRRESGRVAARITFDASEKNEERLLAALPATLDQIDGWIAEGVLMAEEPSVADMMIAPSLALLAYRLDLREDIEARPAGELMRRMLPAPAERRARERAPSSR